LFVCCSLKRETKMNTRMIMLGAFGAFALCMVASLVCTLCSGGVPWMDRTIVVTGAKMEYCLYPYKVCIDITGSAVEETHECKYQSAICDSGTQTVTLSVKGEGDAAEKDCNAIKRGTASTVLFSIAGIVGIIGAVLAVFDIIRRGEIRMLMFIAYGCFAFMIVLIIIAGSLEFSSCHDINGELKPYGFGMDYSTGAATFGVALGTAVVGVAAHVVYFFLRRKSSDSAERTPLK